MAKKLEVFDRKQTDWGGLWYHAEFGGFSSQTISLAKLREFKGTVRLYVKKNQFYKQGSDRPNYTFCIKDADSENFKTLDVSDEIEYAKRDEDGIWRTSDGERLYTRSEALNAIDEAIEDTRYTSYDDMSADYYLKKHKRI